MQGDTLDHAENPGDRRYGAQSQDDRGDA